MIDQGRNTRRALDAYDRDAGTTEEFCHDRDLSIATDLDSDKKKKQKGPPGFGTSQIYCFK